MDEATIKLMKTLYAAEAAFQAARSAYFKADTSANYAAFIAAQNEYVRLEQAAYGRR